MHTTKLQVDENLDAVVFLDGGVALPQDVLDAFHLALPTHKAQISEVVIGQDADFSGFGLHGVDLAPGKWYKGTLVVRSDPAK